LRLIEIDDAGWGDLIGGVFICFNDVTNKRHVIKEIPVEYFQGELFTTKAYMDKSRELVKEALVELDVNDSDDIEFHVCTGYVNNAIASFLMEKNFKVVRCKIEGETQCLVERVYDSFVKDLTGLSSVPPSGRRFFTLLKWVREDLANREKYVKTGWRSWGERWRTKETQRGYKACVNCKWLRYSGPHVGCFYNYEYHGWMPKRALRIPTKCPNWERCRG